MDPNDTPEEPGTLNAAGGRPPHTEKAGSPHEPAGKGEEALVEKVIAKLLQARQAGTLRLSSTGGVLLDHGANGLPPLATVIGADPPGADAPPQGAILHTANGESRGWILLQLWSELRLIPQMYFDPRYRLSRTGQIAGPALLVVFLLCYFLFPILVPIPIVSPILERIGYLLLGIVFYKVMTRELIRYRSVLDYLSRYGHR